MEIIHADDLNKFTLVRTKLGIDNEVYFLRKGRSKIVGVIKKYSKKNASQVDGIISVHNWLSNNNIPVPRARFFKKDINTQPQVLLEYISGYHICRPTKKQLTEIASIMATIHLLKPPTFINKIKPFDFEYFLDLCKHFKYIGNIKDIYYGIDCSYLSRLQKTFIHGDIIQSNLLFSKSGNLICVLDFDHSGVGYRLTDVTRSLIYFAFPFGRINYEIISDFYLEYSKKVHFNDAEILSFFDHMKLLMIRILLETYYYTEVEKTVSKNIFLENSYNLSPEILYRQLRQIKDLRGLQL